MLSRAGLGARRRPREWSAYDYIAPDTDVPPESFVVDIVPAELP
ncbi:MAG: hypothetical protein WBF57_21575 [Mycobacterium sp.]